MVQKINIIFFCVFFEEERRLENLPFKFVSWLLVKKKEKGIYNEARSGTWLLVTIVEITYPCLMGNI